MIIPIFTDDAGWHGKELKTALKKRGVDSIFISLKACHLSISSTQSNTNTADSNFSQNADLSLNPGLSQKLHLVATTKITISDLINAYPHGAFVRGVAGGTLQQVMMRLNVLHMLSMQGVKIYNQGRAIERTVDKAMTSFLLQQHGVSTPATWACENRNQAESIRQAAEDNHQQLIIKPLFGSQGQGVRKLPFNERLPVPMELHVEGVYYLQQLIETANAPHDYRVFVINGKVVATMKRIGSQWVNNIAAGGRCEAFQPDEIMINLALQAALAIDIDYCGVDIIQAQTGEYYVLEVNSIPAWRGLQGVTQPNIAALLVDDFLSKLSSHE